MARPRIAILHQGFIPDYRVRFFELLSGQREIEYVVVHGEPRIQSGHSAAAGPFEFPQLEVENREISLGGKTVLYQPVVRAIAGPAFDGAVLGSELRLLSNAALFALLKARRQPVLIWGQGGEKDEYVGPAMRVVSRIGSRMKFTAARLADGYLVYTDAGKVRLVERGMDPAKVFVVRNTLDVEREIELHRGLQTEPSGALREELGLRPDAVVLLFIGRLYREKEPLDFVRLVRTLREDGRPVEAVVVGDGPELAATQAAARGFSGVRFTGEIREPERVARYMRVADALVIPGKVGLAVNHALAHGVPVITRASGLHAPEFEYLESGHNGIVAPGGFADFVSRVARFIDSPAEQRALAAGALESREGLTITTMVESFHAAVREVLLRRSRPGDRGIRRAGPGGAAARETRVRVPRVR